MNPNCSVARGSLGTALALVGRTAESIKQQSIAIRMNPRDPSIFFRFSSLAIASYVAGDYPAAIEWAERAIHHNPRWQHAHFILVASHIALGQTEAAQGAVQSCREVLPDITAMAAERGPLKDEAKMEELRTRLRAAGFV